jgi:serine/threonine-protein kinase
VHRDVKPGNLLVSDSEVVKLADFGIARALDQSSITQVGSVLGTAAYLSPEQARGDEAGPRADLYSLGVVTYQLISGRLPYEAASLSELALKQQRESPIPLDELVPEVPHALAQAVSMALSIDQNARPASAVELGEMLRDGARGVAPAGAADANFATSASTRVTDRRPTAATRLSTPVPAPATPTRSTRPLTPREVPARQAPRRAAAPAGRRQAAPERAPQRSGRGFRRLIGFLSLLAVLALIAIAAVLIANSTSNTVVHYQKIVGHDAQTAIAQLQKLIDKYTR